MHETKYNRAMREKIIEYYRLLGVRRFYYSIEMAKRVCDMHGERYALEIIDEEANRMKRLQPKGIL